MKRLPALLATFLAAVVGLTAFAWVRAGQDRYAGLEAEAQALASVLRDAVVDSAATLEAAEKALGDRLLAAARRADVELAHSRRAAKEVLQEVAREERVGRIFLFDEARRVVAWTRQADPVAGGPDEVVSKEQVDALEVEDAERAAKALTPGPRGTSVEGMKPNAFGTRDRFGVTYGRPEGGMLLLRAEAYEIQDLRRFGAEPAFERVRRARGVASASLSPGFGCPDCPGPYATTSEDGRSVVEAEAETPMDREVATVRVALDTTPADIGVSRSRSWILLAGFLACAVAVGSVFLLRTRERKAESDKVMLAERKDEDRRLAEAGALASLFAHEISNPLNSIRLGLRLLDGKGSEEEAESVLATVRSESARMATSLEGFLALAQGRGTGRDVIDASVLDEVARIVEAHAVRRRVHVDRRVAADAPAATGSRPVIEQALTSLVRNAIEASPQEASVKIAWSRDKDGGVLVTVEDHGPGFPPGDRADLLRLGRSRREGGHGLGLPLAERFVAAHGGTLTLADADGGGARVEVRLPAAHGKMDA